MTSIEYSVTDPSVGSRKAILNFTLYLRGLTFPEAAPLGAAMANAVNSYLSLWFTVANAHAVFVMSGELKSFIRHCAPVASAVNSSCLSLWSTHRTLANAHAVFASDYGLKFFI